MLEIKNLHARIAETGTEIIRGLNLTVKDGEIAAIMAKVPPAQRVAIIDALTAFREAAGEDDDVPSVPW